MIEKVRNQLMFPVIWNKMIWEIEYWAKQGEPCDAKLQGLGRQPVAIYIKIFVECCRLLVLQCSFCREEKRNLCLDDEDEEINCDKNIIFSSTCCLYNGVTHYLA